MLLPECSRAEQAKTSCGIVCYIDYKADATCLVSFYGDGDKKGEWELPSEKDAKQFAETMVLTGAIL